jgi:hypothetical protein
MDDLDYASSEQWHTLRISRRAVLQPNREAWMWLQPAFSADSGAGVCCAVVLRSRISAEAIMAC